MGARAARCRGAAAPCAPLHRRSGPAGVGETPRPEIKRVSRLESVLGSEPEPTSQSKPVPGPGLVPRPQAPPGRRRRPPSWPQRLQPITLRAAAPAQRAALEPRGNGHAAAQHQRKAERHGAPRCTLGDVVRGVHCLPHFVRTKTPNQTKTQNPKPNPTKTADQKTQPNNYTKKKTKQKTPKTQTTTQSNKNPNQRENKTKTTPPTTHPPTHPINQNKKLKPKQNQTTPKAQNQTKNKPKQQTNKHPKTTTGKKSNWFGTCW